LALAFVLAAEGLVILATVLRRFHPSDLDIILDAAPWLIASKLGRTGLGLHIVYNIVTQKFGGHISLKSQPGHGTAFTILIPSLSPPLLPHADDVIE
jgi:hypothetical protein